MPEVENHAGVAAFDYNGYAGKGFMKISLDKKQNPVHPGHCSAAWLVCAGLSVSQRQWSRQHGKQMRHSYPQSGWQESGHQPISGAGQRRVVELGLQLSSKSNAHQGP